MAHLQPPCSHVIISQRFLKESNHGFTKAIKGSRVRISSTRARGRPWKLQFQSGSSNSNGKNRRVGSTLVQHSSTSQSSSTATADTEPHQMMGSEDGSLLDEGFEVLVKEHGWMVRRMDEEECEIRKVAQIQAEAFHEPAALFNDVFFQFFQAEVLSGLLYRLRNSPPDRYACLVAQPVTEASDLQPQLVGVVDVTVLRDEDVLVHLEGAGEYLYVSGIAVSNSFRRQKVATVLLKACEVISILWGHEYLVLRAYEDDQGSRALYEKAGFRVVSGDPSWVSWVGRRRRNLMFKRSGLGRESVRVQDNCELTSTEK